MGLAVGLLLASGWPGFCGYAGQTAQLGAGGDPSYKIGEAVLFSVDSLARAGG